MSLDTYTNLKTEMAGWLNRQDLTSAIPTFITAFEAKFERNPKMRVRQMIVRSTANVEDQFTSLPSDFLALHNVQLNDVDPPASALKYGTMDVLDEIRANCPEGGQPTHFTIVGDTLEVAPVPNDIYEVEIVYYAKLEKLSGSVASNWLLEDHPDLYLYGSLMQAAPYLKDDERILVWKTLVDEAINELELANETATKGKGPINSRLRRSYGRR